MIPKRLVLENFLSFGTPAVEIAFADDEPLWVLSGPNGVGKSAVFDAMTYALFACHRGGKQDADQLIRHGANGFRVVFDFAFAGVEYRITRTRTKSGRTTQKVEHFAKDTDEWLPVPGVTSAADVQKWAVSTLGVGFDQFKASVLLRQGEADAIITANGRERLALLKKIIGAERYESLSERVHEAVKRLRSTLENLTTRRDTLPAVTEAGVTTANALLTQAASERAAAHGQVALATERVAHAKQWAALEVKRQRLEAQIAKAIERSGDADRIRADKSRLDELTAVIPKLRQVVALREQLTKTTEAFATQSGEQGRLTVRCDELVAAVKQERDKAETHRIAADVLTTDAQRLRAEIERERKFVAAADDVARLRADLDAFPRDLPAQVTRARDRALTAGEAVAAAGRAKAVAAGLLKQAQARKTAVASLAVGVTCSQCGQVVTAEHADRERERLAAEVNALAKRVGAAGAAEDDAITAKAAAEAELGGLDRLFRQQQDKAKLLAGQQQTLANLGVTADAGELRQLLAGKAAEVERIDRARTAEAAGHAAAVKEADRLDAEQGRALRRLAALDQGIRAAEQAIAADRRQDETLRQQLSVSWQTQVNTLDADGVKRHDMERQALADSGVADAFRQLEQDAALRDEWARQRAVVLEEIAAIPDDARLPVADAEHGATIAKQAAIAADKAHDDAKANAADLKRRDEELRKLAADIHAAERRLDLHRRLDDLLGKEGLQRELVKEAEREIVHLANDTVQKLSDGDLSIELDEAADGEGEAFALRVRRADDPTPIGVNYLSGSQKFRVAVAVALAIGRYATGQARPLESVIIDEGFGSLDRDGLESMAAELNRLGQFLRRIVLVSHQEEFAGRFPVGYRLGHGENGTTAVAFRR